MENPNSLREAPTVITGVKSEMTEANKGLWYEDIVNTGTYALDLGGSRSWATIPLDSEDERTHQVAICATIGAAFHNVLAQLEWDEPTTHGRAALLGVIKQHAVKMGSVIADFNEGTSSLTYEEASRKAAGHYAAIADNLRKFVLGEFNRPKSNAPQQ